MDGETNQEKKIEANSVVELNEIDGQVLISGIAQQTGLNLVDQKSLSSIDELSNSSDQLKNEELQLVPMRDLPVKLEIGDQLHGLIGLSELINQLRTHLLELSHLIDISEQRLETYTDEGLTVDYLVTSREIQLNQQLSQELLLAKQSILDKYIKKQVRINLLLSALDQLSLGQYIEENRYSIIKEQLNNWSFIINSILQNLVKNQDLQQLMEAEYQKQAGVGEGEINRLKLLLTGERAGQDFALVEKLRSRVLQILLGNTDLSQKKVVGQDLSEELFETASLINDWRLIDRLKKEAGIDLLDMKKKVENYQNEAKNNPFQSEKLSKDLEENILIPIASAVNRLFPHLDTYSPSCLATVLYRQEAVCVGKAEILSTIFKLLGLYSRSAHVLSTIDKHSDHAANITSMLNGDLLVIDGNYSARANYSNLELDQLKNENPQEYEYVQKVIANGRIITPEVNFLIYRLKKINEQEFLDQHDFKAELINSTGQLEYYRSNIPYPHQKIIDVISLPFSSGVRSNYVRLLIKKQDLKRAQHHIQLALESSPFDPSLNQTMAGFLYIQGFFVEAIPYYQMAIQDNNSQSFINNLVRLGDCLQEVAKNQEAINYYEQALKIKKKNPHLKSEYSDDQIYSRIAKLQRW